MNDEFLAAYRRQDAEAIARLRRWIAVASSPYRARLTAWQQELRWEDLQQELYLEVHAVLVGDQFRGDSLVKTYVWRCVNNSCIDLLRRQARRAQVSESIDEDRHGVEPRWALGERRDLRRILSRLPAQCLELWQRIVKGQSYREMSEDLGVREGTLRVRVLRCRRLATAVRDDACNETAVEEPE
ncbi:MAG: sigma-70 family RNA polymerase sigma factor [Acidobacteriota bacterium]